MVEQTAAGPRERYRQQVKAEVRDRAWQQIADAGASALSLKAIAKQMGITAPALYRYYASRDDLLTELILAAYRDLAGVVEQAAAEGLAAVAQAIRAWALADTHRYLLIYGTPVPGYRAPPEATELARRIFAPVLAVLGADGALPFWTRLHGVLSLEAAGHFTGMAFDPAALYASEVATLLDSRP